MNILSIIPARGGSKQIPKKNIIPVGGKPLIAWTIEASLQSKYITRTLVSSDSAEILKISKKNWGRNTEKTELFIDGYIALGTRYISRIDAPSEKRGISTRYYCFPAANISSAKPFSYR